MENKGRGVKMAEIPGKTRFYKETGKNEKN
jgi:hypothetical protein